MNTLDIGGIALTLQGPEHWLAPLNTAWAEWQSSIAGVQVQLLPDETLPTPTCAYFEARPRFVAGVCNLEVPGFVGRIDAEAGTATLRAHPAAAGGDLVY
ncbi:MAG: hypothetical protein RBT75_21545, partial [Anaerolineae bacterium]|nr:hypothetical protein [Anaerolineae bacterium]